MAKPGRPASRGPQRVKVTIRITPETIEMIDELRDRVAAPNRDLVVEEAVRRAARDPFSRRVVLAAVAERAAEEAPPGSD
jgi:Arc/MetJ-type ribon-helix-helix transcriptional regulator